MKDYETTASDSAKILAADQGSTQNNNSTRRGMTQAERQDAIKCALEKGNITQEQADKLDTYFMSEYGVILIPASSLVPEAIDWVWEGHLSAGKLK